MRYKLKILFFSFFLYGCTFSDLTDPITNLLKSDEILFLSAYENVKIVEQDSKLTGKNSHPVNISGERIEGALKLLLFRVGRKTSSLFPDDKLKIITDNISKGLSTAKSNEDVIFTIESWYADLPGTRLKDNRVVSGRVFKTRLTTVSIIWKTTSSSVLLDAVKRPVAKPTGEKGREPALEVAVWLAFQRIWLFLSFKNKVRPTFVDEYAK